MVRFPVVGPPKLAKIGRWMAVLIFSNPRATLAGVRPKFLGSTGGNWEDTPHGYGFGRKMRTDEIVDYI